MTHPASTAIASGVLIIDKPVGVSSHDVVGYVKRLLRARKVGHFGTLDPAASGVLPLAINGATRFATQLAGKEKEYEFCLVLGRTTDTDDDTGRTVSTAEVRDEKRAQLHAMLPQYIGNILQRPPVFSAIKVEGQRAYALAREGTAPTLTPRLVVIRSLTIVEETHWPVVRMRMCCESGTYVRSLCRDLGEALGVGGHARDIRRLASGRFRLESSLTLKALWEQREQWERCLIPLGKLLENSALETYPVSSVHGPEPEMVW